MNSETLRNLQAPLKDRYRNEPQSALATLVAKGSVDVDSISFRIERDPNSPEVAGLHPMAGGDGNWACAAEMLLESLISCAGVTFGAVCTALEIPIDSAQLVASGDLDFRGTLGVDRETPVGFLKIDLEFMIDSPANDEKLAKAVQLAERYCVVAQTLKSVNASWSRKS